MLKIAYISYEHPTSISGGGIGTYIGQVAKLMAKRGHQVEVFSGTLADTSSEVEIDGYVLNLIPAYTKEQFRTSVLSTFKRRHLVVSYDIMESPEYGADAFYIKKAFPKLPLSLKLHTPSFLISKLNDKSSWKDKLRYMVGGLVRGKISNPYWMYKKKNDLEYKLFNLAETCSSPSRSLANIVSEKWSSKKEIYVLPNPFEICDELLAIKPIEDARSATIITFLGKLERRKGILSLIDAIPKIVESYPFVHFCLVGKSGSSPESTLDMISFIKIKTPGHEFFLEFMGFQDNSVIPKILEKSHICIFPSLWENFPYVCLEAMAANRVVIGTDNGGMADMISHNINGILIAPNSSDAIYNAIKTLVDNPERIKALGEAARKTILNNYNAEKIGSLTETLYKKTIFKSV